MMMLVVVLLEPFDPLGSFAGSVAISRRVGAEERRPHIHTEVCKFEQTQAVRAD
jgi:hypothetical protein